MDLTEYNHNARQYKKMQQKQNMQQKQDMQAKVEPDKEEQPQIQTDYDNLAKSLPLSWRLSQTMQVGKSPKENGYFKALATAYLQSNKLATDTALSSILNYAKQGQFNLNYLIQAGQYLNNRQLWNIPPATICHVIALKMNAYYGQMHNLIVMDGENPRYLTFADVEDRLPQAPGIIAQAIRDGKTMHASGSNRRSYQNVLNDVKQFTPQEAAALYATLEKILSSYQQR